jgi:hypothetical protein
LDFAEMGRSVLRPYMFERESDADSKREVGTAQKI